MLFSVLERRFGLGILLVIAIGVGCTHSNSGYRLSGRFADKAGQTAILLHCTFNTTDTIGLVRLGEDGSFHFEGNLTEPSLCVLRLDGDDLLFMLDNVEMTLHSDTFSNRHLLKIEGYDRAQLFHKAMLLDKDRIVRYDATEKVLQQRIAQGDSTMSVALMQQELAQLDQQFRTNLKQFVASTSDPIVGIFLMHLLSTQQDFGFIQKQFDRLQRMDSTSIYAQQMEGRLHRAQQILVAHAPVYLNDSR